MGVTRYHFVRKGDLWVKNCLSIIPSLTYSQQDRWIGNLYYVLFLHQPFYQALKTVEVVRVGIYIKEFALLVEEFVGGKAVYIQVGLYGILLGTGQVVVDYIVARNIVFLDYILPAVFRRTVGEIEIYHRVVF